jgi:hypothetical protein
MSFDTPDFEAGPASHAPQVWQSSSGDAWESQEIRGIDPGAYFAAVVGLPDGSLRALGSIDDIATGVQAGFAAWDSPDGRTWARIDAGVDADFQLHAFASGPKGITIIGDRFSATDAATEIWYSSDGIEWRRVYSVPITDDAPAALTDIGAGEDGFVATGYRGLSDAPEPFVVASGDGQNWFEAPPQPALDEMGTGGQVAALGGDWVIAANGEGSVPIWRSVDGLQWERVATIDTSSIEDGRVSSAALVSVPDGLFLTIQPGCCRAFPSPIGVWTSGDGQAWQMSSFPAESMLRAAVSTSITTILAGNLGGREADATIWTQHR